MTIQDPPERRLTVRIRCDGLVFLIEVSQLREEVPALYRGFERWDSDQFPTVPLQRMVEVQKDMRLCVDMPTHGLSFCDLTQEDLTADPFQIFDTAHLYRHEIWEYLPYQQSTQRLYPPSDSLEQLLDIFDQTLYD